MSNSKDSLIAQLKSLNLSGDEALVYVELLRGPSTHLQLSRDTDINRTKIYRIIEQLEKRSLVARRTDDRGVFVVASSPSNLEIEIAVREAKTKQQRITFTQLAPMLTDLQSMQRDPFVIRTYEGESGFKQMCWHELKAEGELVALGGAAIEELIPSHNWAEKYRELSTETGFSIREIVNVEVDSRTFTKNERYMKKYYCRGITRDVLSFTGATSIYNDTVAIYYHRDQKKVGVEIISQGYADMMRAIFEHYWTLGAPLE